MNSDEVQCKNCGDSIDTSHNPKFCLKCNKPLSSYKGEKQSPWYTQESYAFLISAIIAVTLLFLAIALEGVPFIGKFLTIIVFSLAWVLCPVTYKILVSKRR